MTTTTLGHRDHEPDQQPDQRRDRGAGRVELAVMLGLVGVLASALLVIGGVRASADDATCELVARSLATAAVTYLDTTGTSSIPDAGGPDGYEQTLVDAGLLGAATDLYDVDATGALVASGSRCPG